MKKTIILLLFICMLSISLSGCIIESDTSSDITEDPMNVDLLAYYKRLNKFCDEMDEKANNPLYADPEEELDTTILNPSGREAQESFVGYGINVLRGSSYSDGLSGQWFIDGAYGTSTEPSVYITSDPLDIYNGSTSVSTSLEEVFTKLSINAKVGTGKAVPFFSGNVSAQFDRSTKVTSNTKFYNSIDSYIFDKQSVKIQYMTAKSIMNNQLVDANVLDMINTINMKEQYNNEGKVEMVEVSEEVAINQAIFLMNSIGTHLITSAGTGGSVTVSSICTSSSTTTDQEIKAAFDFNSSYVSGEFSSSFITNNAQVHSNSTIKIKGIGGDISKLYTGSNVEEIAKSINEWRKTIKSKPNLAYVYNALPIWDFALSEKVSNIFQKAFDRMSASNMQELDTRKYFTNVMDLLDDGGVYTFTPVRSLTVCIHAAMAATFEPVHLWKKYNDSYTMQQWIAVPEPSKPGFYYLMNRNTSHYISVREAKTNENQPLITWNLKGPAQLFKIQKTPDGNSYYLIPYIAQNMVVSVNKNNYDNGSQLVIKYKVPGDTSQMWTISKLDFSK